MHASDAEARQGNRRSLGKREVAIRNPASGAQQRGATMEQKSVGRVKIGTTGISTQESLEKGRQAFADEAIPISGESDLHQVTWLMP